MPDIIQQVIDLFALIRQHSPASNNWLRRRVSGPRVAVDDHVRRLAGAILAQSRDTDDKEARGLEEELRHLQRMIHHDLWDPEQGVAAALWRLRGKTMFGVTALLGVGVADVQDGDIVVVSSQFFRPLILRPQQNSASTGRSEERFRLVGFAYIGGLMADGCEDYALAAELSLYESKTFAVC
jgi:hypothetical protein